MNRLSNEMQLSLDEVSSSFLGSWSQDSVSSISACLTEVPSEAREALAKRLVRADINQRVSCGLSVDSELYRDLGESAYKVALETSSRIDESLFEESFDQQQDSQEPGSSQETDLTGVESVFRRIDNYELLKELGSGGMGEVFLARHHKFRNRYFAIKIVRQTSMAKKPLQRFEQEIQVAGQLQHPNIVYSFDAGATNGAPYLVMEYVQGIDLQTVVSQHGPLPIENACEVIRQAAAGFDFANREAGLIHRDIKPSNLMLSENGTVKILDFGLARLRDQGETPAVTADGQMLGTPDYMAPEQWEDSSKVDATADIYSLACTLFTLLTGVPPFAEESGSVVAKMTAHISKDPPDLTKLRPETPKPLADLIAKCMAKDPTTRIESHADFAKHLEQFSEGFNLSEYVGQLPNNLPAAAVPTSVSSSPSAVTKREDSLGTSNSKPSSARIRIAGISAVVVIAAFATGYFLFFSENPDATAETSVVALRLTADQEYKGQINGDSPEGRVVFENERSRLEVLFPEKRHFMVLGITPNEGEGKVYCLWPPDLDSSSSLQDGFIYGKRTKDQLLLNFNERHEVAVREGTWQYTDGAGLHAFIVVSAKSPLPKFEEARQQLLELDWPTSEVSPRHWKVVSGEAFVHEFQSQAVRAPDDTNSFRLQPIVDRLQEIFPSAEIDGIVFDVRPSVEN